MLRCAEGSARFHSAKSDANSQPHDIDSANSDCCRVTFHRGEHRCVFRNRSKNGVPEMKTFIFVLVLLASVAAFANEMQLTAAAETPATAPASAETTPDLAASAPPKTPAHTPATAQVAAKPVAQTYFVCTLPASAAGVLTYY